MSTLPVQPVTCEFKSPDGTPLLGVSLLFELVAKDASGNVDACTEIFQGFVAPTRVQAKTDAAGVAVVSLFPNLLGNKGSQYQVTAFAANGVRVLDARMATVPNAPCNLYDIIDAAAPDIPPIARGFTLFVNGGDVLTGQLVGEAPDGQSLTFVLLGQPANGTVVLDDASAGAFTYTPDANFSGSDTFQFAVQAGTLTSQPATATMTVIGVTNPAPVATGASISLAEDGSYSGTLVATDANNTALTYSIVSAATHGTVVITDASTGAYTYTPSANYNGADSFTFKANDGNADSNTATVNITVTAVNDAPVNTVPGAQSVGYQTPLTFSTGGFNPISVNDADGGSLTTTISVSHGTLAATAGSGATLTNNGTATVMISGTVAQVNAALAGLAYTPANGFSGADTMTVSTTDGAAADVDTIALTVAAAPSGMALGFNIGQLNTYDGTLSLANILMNSTAWELESETNAGTTVWTQRNGQVAVAAVTGTAVFRRVIYASDYLSLADYMPVGTYTAKNSNASNNIGFGAYTNTAKLGFSTTTADRTFSFAAAVDGTLCLHLQVTATGTYGSGLRLLLPGHDGSSYFNSQALTWMSGLGNAGAGPVRFMDYASTNLSVDTDWADRTVTTNSAIDPSAGVPWEICIALCNQLNRDLWINVPVRATDAYVASLASLIFGSLNSNLNVNVEYANELWNQDGPFFASTQWATYLNHPRYAATVDPSTGIVTHAGHGLANGAVILGFATKNTVANGINKDSVSANSNYYYAHNGGTCSVSDVTTNTFRIKQYDNGVVGPYITFPAVRGAASYATNSVTDLIYVNTADAGSTNLDTNYANRSISIWSTFDTVFGASNSRVKAVMGTQVGNDGRATARLAVTGATRADYLAGAPYYKGLWQHCAVDVASGQFTPKIWTTDTGTSTVNYGVYAQGSTPYNYEVKNGSGTGLVAGTHKQFTATYGGSSAYTSAASAATGATNGTTYTHCIVVTDSNGNDWRINKDIAASASASTVDVPDSYANQALRHLVYVNDVDLPYIAANKAAIAASSNPNCKYIDYETAPANQDEELHAPSAALSWMRAYMGSAENKAVEKLNITKQAANGVDRMAWYYDISTTGVSWAFAKSYADTTDPRYVGYKEFVGVAPITTPLAPANITATAVTSTPSLPYVVTALPSDGTTYTVVKASPSADQYDVSGGNLRLLSNLGINYAASATQTIRLRKSDGATDTFFNVSMDTGPANWWPSFSAFVHDSIADTDPAVLDALKGTNGTLAGPAATVSGALWLNGASTAYNAGTTGALNLTTTNVLFAVLINDNAQTSAVDIVAQLSSVGGSDSLVGIGTYFSSGPQTLDIRLSSSGGAFDQQYPAAPKDGVSKIVWWMSDKPNGKMYYGYNQTEKNAGAGAAFPASMGTSLNAFLGTLSSSMKYGSILVVPQAGMTLAQAKAYVQAMQTHHGL